MRYIFLLLLSLFAAGSVDAQSFKFLVEFTDKSNTPYSVGDPSQYLSARAIQRRTKQNISISSTDLPVDPNYVQGIANTGVSILQRSRWMNAVIIETTDTSMMAQIRSLPFVRSATKVRKLRSMTPVQEKMPVIVKELQGQQNRAAAAYDYGPSYTQINMIGGDQLHNQGFKGQGMVIAVLDAGFQDVNIHPAFDSLRADNRILGTVDFVTNDNSVYEDHWHGMAVLSTMAGNLPGQLVGTAPEASYWLLRSEDANTEYVVEEANWVVAAEFADSVGADVINSSLGYTVFDDPSQSHTYAQMDGNTTIITRGADMAASKGILVVNSAGNEGNSAWNYIGAPADGDSVLSIGAVDSARVYVSFSSNGPTSDGRIKPNVCARGSQAVLANPWSTGIFQGNGTSFSGPIVAGMAACLWQTDPNRSNMEVFRAIERSAHKYSNPDYDYGYGIPNFSLAKLLLTDVANLPATDKTNILVYPNPFTESMSFLLYSADSQQISLEVYGMKGELVYRQQLSAEGNSFIPGVLNLPADLSSGMYLLRLSGNEGTTFTKIIRN